MRQLLARYGGQLHDVGTGRGGSAGSLVIALTLAADRVSRAHGDHERYLLDAHTGVDIYVAPPNLLQPFLKSTPNKHSTLAPDGRSRLVPVICGMEMVGAAGLEPATLSLEG